jgi:hypothetical protein
MYCQPLPPLLLLLLFPAHLLLPMPAASSRRCSLAS